MDASPLGRLPAELRVEIYTLCFPMDRTVSVYCRDNCLHSHLGPPAAGIHGDRRKKMPRYILALLQTCRLARKECSKIVYNTRTFHVELAGGLQEHMVGVDETRSPLHRFLSSIGKDNAALIQSLVVDLGYCTYLLFWSREEAPRKAVEDVLLELSRLAMENPGYHLQARPFTWFKWGEQYTIDLSRTAVALKAVGDEIANKLVGNDWELATREKEKKAVGYIRQWEKAAAAAFGGGSAA